MTHALILPLILPLLFGSLLLVTHGINRSFKRCVSMLATWAQIPLAIWLVYMAGDGQLRIYALGNWEPPFGIILLLDRLSALMLLLSAVLASFALLYACRGDDQRGPNFHALFQFQLLGINGAFMTGDLFNLFVFFEILLIASYALLMHGNGAARVRAGMHYVVLNLVGSSFFLIGVGTLYGLLGTLNMADLAQRVANADAELAPLLSVAGLLLLVVFGLKAAILPLYFWLPRAYAAATAPVAALFAIMTKVGIYVILRVYTLIFGNEAGEVAGLANDWLWPLALLTLAAGACGALAARSLQGVVAYLVVVSVGTLLAVITLGTPESYAAALYYLLHSTLICGGLFLLADLVARQRGEFAGALQQGPTLHNAAVLGGLFFAGAISVAGLPPFAGFLGKVMLLRSAGTGMAALQLWSVVLVGSLVTIIALSRAGSTVFWRGSGEPASTTRYDAGRLVATLGLMLASVALVLAAGPLQHYLNATAAQLLDLAPYMQLIGGGTP